MCVFYYCFFLFWVPSFGFQGRPKGAKVPGVDSPFLSIIVCFVPQKKPGPFFPGFLAVFWKEASLNKTNGGRSVLEKSCSTGSFPGPTVECRQDFTSFTWSSWRWEDGVSEEKGWNGPLRKSTLVYSYGCGSKKRYHNWNPGKWKHGPKPA